MLVAAAVDAPPADADENDEPVADPPTIEGVDDSTRGVDDSTEINELERAEVAVVLASSLVLAIESALDVSRSSALADVAASDAVLVGEADVDVSEDDPRSDESDLPEL